MISFREVKVWEKSHQAVLHVYRLTAGFPLAEQYGLTTQLRRIAVAVPSKIAEACGRGNDRDLARFLETARGYAWEVESLAFLARELGYLSEEEHAPLAEELVEERTHGLGGRLARGAEVDQQHPARAPGRGIDAGGSRHGDAC